MQLIQIKQYHRQAGVTMFEITLAMAVAVFMTVLIVKMQKSANDDLRAKTAADSMLVFVQAAQRYLDKDTNRASLVKAMWDGTNAGTLCRVWNGTTYDTINDTTKKTCAVDLKFLRDDKKILPSTVPLTNNFGQTWVAIYRKTKPTDQSDEDVEILVVASGGEKAVPAQYGLAAQLLGGIGGFVPDQGAICGKDVCGSGGWSVNLADFGAEKKL